MCLIIPQSAFTENSHLAGNSKINIRRRALAEILANRSHILQLNLMHLQLHISGCGRLAAGRILYIST